MLGWQTKGTSCNMGNFSQIWGKRFHHDDALTLDRVQNSAWKRPWQLSHTAGPVLSRVMNYMTSTGPFQPELFDDYMNPRYILTVSIYSVWFASMQLYEVALYTRDAWFSKLITLFPSRLPNTLPFLAKPDLQHKCISIHFFICTVLGKQLVYYTYYSVFQVMDQNSN